MNKVNSCGRDETLKTENRDLCIFCKRMMRLLVEHDETPMDLAMALGLSIHPVIRWIVGQSLPNVNTCMAIAYHYNLKLDELLEGLGNE